MANKTLYVEIFQPFAQYRNPFTFYYAQTYPLPPKSTIIGMLQNATNNYYDERFWDLQISIHGGFETVFWNYQQLIKGEISFSNNGDLINYHKDNISTKIGSWLPVYKLSTINLTSKRSPICQQELFNGHLFIFIRGDGGLIEEIKESLEKPKKVLSLGRSEDVVFLKSKPTILEDEGIKSDNKQIKKTLWLTYPTYIKLNNKNKERTGFPIKNKKFPVYSIPVKVLFKNNSRTIKNKAELNKNTKREVEFETVIHTSHDYIIYLKKEILIEIYKMNDKIFKIPKDFGWL